MKSTLLNAAVLSCATVLCAGCGTSTTDTAQTPPQSASALTGTVTIQINAEGIDQKFQVTDVASGTTVAKVMRQVDGLELDIVGDGEMTFMNSIAGKSTSTTEGWTYTVDGEFAEVSIGAKELSPPTTVEWKFGDWEASR